jgi:hypothetical protein
LTCSAPSSLIQRKFEPMTDGEKLAQPVFPAQSSAPESSSAQQASAARVAAAKSPEAAAADTADAASSSWGRSALALFSGFCLGGVVGYFLSPAPPLDETRFLNFDRESTPRGYLVSGFSGSEASEQGDTFQWCDSRVVRLKVTSRGDGDRTLRMRYWPFVYPNGPAQSISVLVNENLVGERVMPALPSVATFHVPAHIWLKGDNEIRFKFKYAEAPSLRAPPSQDKRTLSAAFDWLEIVTP